MDPKRILPAAIAVLLAVSGCSRQAAPETTAAPTAAVTSPPAVTEAPAPSAHQLYAQAKAGVADADSIQYSMDFSHTVQLGQNRFTAAVHREFAAEQLHGDLLAQSTQTVSLDTMQLSQSLFITGGTAYGTLDGVAFTGNAETYITETLPWLLIDESLYATGSQRQTSRGTVLTFGDAYAAERWLPGFQPQLTAATGTVTLLDGQIAAMHYEAEYLAQDVPHRVEADIFLRSVNAPLGLAAQQPQGEFADLGGWQVPLLLQIAADRIAAAQSLQLTAAERIHAAAADAVRVQEYSLAASLAGQDFRYAMDNLLTLQQPDSEDVQTHVVQELTQDGMRTVTDGQEELTPLEADDPEFYHSSVARRAALYLPSPAHLESAQLRTDGQTVTVDFTLNRAGATELQYRVSESLFENREELYTTDDAFSVSYARGTLTLDAHTLQPTGLTVQLECSHRIEELGVCSLTLDFEQQLQ